MIMILKMTDRVTGKNYKHTFVGDDLLIFYVPGAEEGIMMRMMKAMATMVLESSVRLSKVLDDCPGLNHQPPHQHSDSSLAQFNLVKICLLLLSIILVTI